MRGCRGTSWGAIANRRFWLPPSLDEWLPEDHFARFVIAAVEAMDLSAFYADTALTDTAARRTIRR